MISMSAFRELAGAMIVGTALSISSAPCMAATFSTLHTFAGGDNDGKYPQAGLTPYGGYLYGTSIDGGTNDAGTLFRVDPNSGSTTLVFAFDSTHGVAPKSRLTVRGTVMYGTTTGGAAYGFGGIYKFDPGNALNPVTLLYSFTTLGECDGDSPHFPGFPSAQLVYAQGWLWGTRCRGGAHDMGTIYRYKVSNGSFQTVHNFAGDAAGDGAYPVAGMTLRSGTLYGTTIAGGNILGGTLFTLDTSAVTPTPTVVYNFPGGGDYTRPAAPATPLTYRGGYFYGASDGGGANQSGTIYRIAPGAWQPQVLHDIQAASDGRFPRDNLQFSGSTLYGSATWIGSSSYGTVFSLQLNGNVWTTIHAFTDGSDSSNPRGGVTVYSQNVFGTASGNANQVNSLGSIFKVTTP